MRKNKARHNLSRALPYAERLANRIAARHPDVRFVLTDSQGPHDPYWLYVLNVPASREYAVVHLVSVEASDILIENGVDILVFPVTKRHTPETLKRLLRPQGSAIELTVAKNAA